MTVRVRAPGRVTLIGEHADFTGGLAVSMSIDRWTEIQGETHDSVLLTSADEYEPALLALEVDDPSAVEPRWARYIAGVVAEMQPRAGIIGTVTTTIPIGAGLASSAALEVATALALGFDGNAPALARRCRSASQRSSGVPCGIVDHLTITSGVTDHALVVDCDAAAVELLRLPENVEIVVQFVAHQPVAGHPFAELIAECAAAERFIGPLREASLDDVLTIPDALVRARAVHVISENRRARQLADAIAAGDLAGAGELLVASHHSLRDLYQTSTPLIDEAVERLLDRPGVHGARMTGGGFGGSVVALAERGAVADGWVLRPGGSAGHVA
jgi:galactokinase